MNKNWTQIDLGKITSRITKGSTPTSYGYNYQDTGIRFVKIENVHVDGLDISSIKQYISDEANAFLSRSQLKERDILFSIAGTIGRTCIIHKGHLPANTNQAFAVIRGYENYILSKFLLYQLNSCAKRVAISKARGGAMNNISLADLASLAIYIAPLPEQRAIVAKLETLLSDLDNAVASLKQAKEQIKTYRQSVLKAAFTGKLRQTNSDKWNKCPLSREIVLSQGIQVPKENQFEEMNNGFVRFLRIIDFTQGTDSPRYILNPGNKYIINKDDIAMVRYGTVGFVCRGFEGAIANNLFMIKPSKDVMKTYLFYFLKSLYFQSVVTLKNKGATMAAISFAMFKEVPFVYPDLTEQSLIVEEIESRFSVADHLDQSINESLSKTEALKLSLLKQAFDGKLLTEEELEQTRQAPDWKPAEILMERIKANPKR